MNYRKPKVSVIIPCFNQGQYIDEAVESVLRQTLQDFEIIIVNDGSTDDFTLDNLKNYNKPKCKVIHTTNQGLSLARNTGINASSGDYLLPLDADDKIGPKYLEEASRVLDTDKRIGIVYCETEFFGDKTGKWIQEDFSIEKMLTMNMIINCAMFRKIDYLSTKGFNPNMIYGWEDWDFWLSLIEIGKGVFKLSDVHFYYRIKNISMLNELSQDSNKQAYSLKTIYQNHFEFYLEKTGNPINIYSDLNKILSSKDYIIGRFVVYPFRTIKKYLKSN